MSQSGGFNTGGGGGGVINTINGDIGSITGANVTIFADNVSNGAGASVLFDNSGTVSTLKLSDSVNNIFLGNLSGNLIATGVQNTAVGVGALNGLTTSSENIAIGTSALVSLTGPVGGAGGNTVVGYAACNQLLTGTANIVLGDAAGSALTSNESANILIGNAGVVGDNRTIRLGETSGGASAQKNYQGGIVGNTVSNAEYVTIDTTTGQLGTTASTSTPFGFTAYASTDLTNVTGTGVAYTVLFNATTRNDGSAYDPSTGLFTAPTTGMYMFTSTLTLVSGSTFSAGSLTLVTAIGSAAGPLLAGFDAAAAINANIFIFSESFALQMTAGDTVGINILSNTTTQDVTVKGFTFSGGSQQQISMFSGFRIA